MNFKGKAAERRFLAEMSWAGGFSNFDSRWRTEPFLFLQSSMPVSSMSPGFTGYKCSVKHRQDFVFAYRFAFALMIWLCL